jgi:hypothetical protein
MYTYNSSAFNQNFVLTFEDTASDIRLVFASITFTLAERLSDEVMTEDSPFGIASGLGFATESLPYAKGHIGFNAIKI